MSDPDILYRRLFEHQMTAQQAKMELILVQGECPKGGVDKLAADWAEAQGEFCMGIAAPWKRGRKAGPQRNEFMVDKARVLAEDGVCNLEAFPDIDSVGTRGCVEYAQQFDDINITVTEI